MTRTASLRPSSVTTSSSSGDSLLRASASGSGSARRRPQEWGERDKDRGHGGDRQQPQKQQGKEDPGGGPVIWRSNVRIEDSTMPAAAAAAAAEPAQAAAATDHAPSAECAMCGDVGFAQELRQCAHCQFRWQHSYCCVQPNPPGVVVSDTGSPTPFLCDWCRLAAPAVLEQKPEHKAPAVAAQRPHNVYRPRIMPEKSSKNGSKDNAAGSLRNIPEGSSASEGSDAMEFLMQAAFEEDAKQQRQEQDSGSNDVPASDYSAGDTVSSTSTIDSVKGARSSSHRHPRDRVLPGPGPGGDAISSSSSHEVIRRRALLEPPPPSKFRDANADDSTDAARRPAPGAAASPTAKDRGLLRSPGFNRSSTTSNNERSSAAPPLPPSPSSGAKQQQAGPFAPSRATSSNGTAGTGALIWMPPVKLMRGFKKSSHVVANRAPVSPSPSSSSRGLQRSESLKVLSERKPPPKEAVVLQRSESLKSTMTRRKHKVLGDINATAQPVADTPSRSGSADAHDHHNNSSNNLSNQQLPALKRMRISSNTVEPAAAASAAAAAAPKALVRRYKSLSDISC